MWFGWYFEANCEYKQKLLKADFCITVSPLYKFYSTEDDNFILSRHYDTLYWSGNGFPRYLNNKLN